MTVENGNDPSSHNKIRQRFGTVTNPAVAHGMGESSGPVTGSSSEQGSSGSVSSQVGLEIRLGQQIQIWLRLIVVLMEFAFNLLPFP